MMRILGTLGYMSFFSTFLIMLFGVAVPLAGASNAGAELHVTALCAFFCGAFIQAVFLKIKARLFEQFAFSVKSVAIFSVLALLLPVYQTAFEGASMSTWPFDLGSNLACFLCGAALLFFFAAWDDLVGRIHIKSFSRTLCVAAFCANAVFLLTMSVSTPLYLLLVCAALLIASGSLLVYLNKLMASFGSARSQSQQADPSPSLDRRIRVLFFVFNIAFGIATGLLLIVSPDVFYLTFVLSLAGLLCLVIALYNDPSIHDRYAPVLLRALAALISICFLLAAFAQHDIGMAFLTVLCAAWQIFWIIDMGLLMNHSDKHGFPIPKHMAESRVLNNGGFLLGLAATVTMLEALPQYNATRALAVLVVLAVIVLTMALLPAESRKSPDKAAEEQSMREYAAKPRASAPQDMQRICDALAKFYQLSPREREVLPYLVRGRNAKHISEELVISEYTAKTHIYNIYKKLDVHSRDDLLNLYEAFEAQK